MCLRSRLVFLLGMVLFGFAPATVWSAEADLFTSQIAPLLRQRCLSCHNAQKKRGGLDLTTRAHLLKGGDSGPAVVPGAAASSRLLHMVRGLRPRMPRQGPKLTPAEVDSLQRWVDAGAPWSTGGPLAEDRSPPREAVWWSLRPLARPPIPAVRNRAWVRTPVDSFILSALEARGLAPSPPADRATLIRRVTFDLHGLPPTPAEIEAFVSDPSPHAYEKLIDRLLASPRYGERWGRHWLDLAHYGDTHGYDKDKRRDHAWPYRDYVIRAFNQDTSYIRFIQEQLAGDVLYPGNPEAVAATGFIVAGPWDFVGQVELREGTVDKEKTRLLDRDDMVSSTFSTFLSLTVGCARCHDHKFDPIPQRDYYRLQAIFAGVERGDRPWDVSEQLLAQRVKLQQDLQRAAGRRAALRQRVGEVTSPDLARLDAELKEARRQLAGLPRLGEGPASPTNGYHSAISATADVEKWAQIDLGRPVPLDAIYLVPARPTDFPDTPGFGFPVRFRVDVADDPAFRNARMVSDHTRADFPNPGAEPYVLDIRGQTARYVRVTARRLWRRTGDYVFALAEVQVGSGGRNVARGAVVTALDSIEAGRWARVYLVDGCDSRQRLPDLCDPRTSVVVQQREALRERIRAAERSRAALAETLLDPGLRAEMGRASAEVADLERRLRALAAPARVYAVVPRAPRPIWVLHRGNVEQHRDLVTPGGLSCVPGLDPDFKGVSPGDEGGRRAALAAWIADPNNVLTWRSVVNRVWHYHFGRGIVDTPSDFGRNGSLPTHPDLLDWLAVNFRAGGGSFKKLHRLILLSAVYRQSSEFQPRGARVDADNRFLWRMNRQRLDAESVRDSVLAVSGKLDPRMGGPGFELFRFKDDHSPVYDHTDLARVYDPATYRRTVYRFTVRSVPNPFLDCLDCADPNLNSPVRNTTLTALQALALLNDPFMALQAEYVANRLRKMTADPGRQVDEAYRLALGRLPGPEERAAVAEYARKHGLANACRLLFNLNEFVFVD